MTAEELAELRRANNLRERSVAALERLTAAPVRRNCLEMVADWWCPDASASMRVSY